MTWEKPKRQVIQSSSLRLKLIQHFQQRTINVERNDKTKESGFRLLSKLWERK